MFVIASWHNVISLAFAATSTRSERRQQRRALFGAGERLAGPRQRRQRRRQIASLELEEPDRCPRFGQHQPEPQALADLLRLSQHLLASASRALNASALPRRAEMRARRGCRRRDGLGVEPFQTVDHRGPLPRQRADDAEGNRGVEDRQTVALADRFLNEPIGGFERAVGFAAVQVGQRQMRPGIEAVPAVRRPEQHPKSVVELM